MPREVTTLRQGRFPIATRSLHPGAWWLWALGLAAAASRTTNPLLLALIAAVAVLVVVTRRSDAPWAVAFRVYLIVAGVIVAMRVLFRVVFGGGTGSLVLFTLPEIPLPEAAGGIRLFGPVAAEQLLAGFYDGLRLATMLICVGAANALANPKRMLRALPGALYEVGTAVVVALAMAPQLVESGARVRRARRLRGARERGVRGMRAVAIPVLVDATDRSLRLAAAMDSRGYGRTAGAPPRSRAVTGALVITGVAGVCVGAYGVLDGTAPAALGTPMLATGVLVAGLGFGLGGRGVRRTRYRPDRWGAAELLVAGCGVAATAVLFVSTRVDPDHLYPSLSPLSWPTLPPLAVAGILLAGLPAVLR